MTPLSDAESPHFPTTAPPRIVSIAMHIIIVVKSCAPSVGDGALVGAAPGGSQEGRGAQVSVL